MRYAKSMQMLDKSAAESIAKALKLNKNMQKRLVAPVCNADWAEYELLPIPTKDGNAGILLIEFASALYAKMYEISTITRSKTGSLKPIICDLCRTWQAGSRAGSLTIHADRRSNNSVTLLCCKDLQCSLHVRTKTNAAKVSRTQLREHISADERIARLRTNLTKRRF